MSRLKDLRKKKNLRLRHIAERLDITPQTVWKHERYGIKTARVAKRYAGIYDCRWQDLLD